MYTPQFVNDPILDGTGKIVGWSQPALTEASAQELALLFPQWIAGVKMLPPEPIGTGGGFHFGSDVPWFIYINGASEDAYDIAILFSPQHNFGPLAWIYASYEIQGTMAAYTPGS